MQKTSRHDLNQNLSIYFIVYLFERLQGLMKQGSTSTGFIPGHSLSGNLAIVLENSRKILQLTSRSRVPSPHVTEHGLQSPEMKLFFCFFVLFFGGIFFFLCMYVVIDRLCNKIFKKKLCFFFFKERGEKNKKKIKKNLRIDKIEKIKMISTKQQRSTLSK